MEQVHDGLRLSGPASGQLCQQRPHHGRPSLDTQTGTGEADLPICPVWQFLFLVQESGSEEHVLLHQSGPIRVALHGAGRRPRGGKRRDGNAEYQAGTAIFRYATLHYRAGRRQGVSAQPEPVPEGSNALGRSRLPRGTGTGGDAGIHPAASHHRSAARRRTAHREQERIQQSPGAEQQGVVPLRRCYGPTPPMVVQWGKTHQHHHAIV